MSDIPIFKPNYVNDTFAGDIWDPFTDVSPPYIPFNSSRVTPLCLAAAAATSSGWDETPEAYVVRVDVPGLKKEEVRVKVREGKFLKISGRKKVEREEKHDSWHHVERSMGKFSKVLTLPENSRADRVRSCLENGVLTVTVPKRDARKSHVVKNIEVNG